MDSRIALKPDTKLFFHNKEGEEHSYTIIREIGRGSSCIVYEASRETTTADIKLYRIKECYPHKLHISRDERGNLLLDTEDKARFDEIANKMCDDFKLANKLFYSAGLTGMVTDQLDVYSHNGTKYIVSAYSAEKTLATYKPASIKECVMLVKQVAYVMNKIHAQGFLYLDTKPNNVLVIENEQSRIQLFDFDSLVDLNELRQKDIKCSDLRLSYSKGYAPVELQTGRIKHIGIHTDVYGVGALLFYLLFGCAPTALDCEEDAIYPFEQMQYNSQNCDDKLFDELNSFFHNTLANYYIDRYQDMQEVYDKLDKIERFADVMVPRFITKEFSAVYIVGREKELKEIDEFVANEEYKCMLITGMEGIGRSTLVRAYIQSRRHQFDNVLYMRFSDTMESTISNDKNIHINTIIADEINDHNVRYFDKKMRKIRELVKDTKTLIVIDDFNGEIDADTIDVLQTGWKVVLVSNLGAKCGDSRELLVKEITNIDCLQEMFEKHLGYHIRSEEQPLFEKIVKQIEGHTAVLELIAKQIASSHKTLLEATLLVEEHGFSNMASEKIHYEIDGERKTDTIKNIIAALFDASNFSEEKRIFLKTFSLIGSEGIEIRLIHNILHIDSMDDVNEIIDDGWLSIEGNVLSMHSVIREVVSDWEWTEKCKEYAEMLLSYFYVEIYIESTKNDYPKKLHDGIVCSKKMIPDEKSDRPLWKKMISWRDEYLEKSFQKGIVGRVQRARYERINNTSPADTKKMHENIWLAEQIILQCKHEEMIKTMEIYTNLLYVTVLNMPIYCESFILGETSKIFMESKDEFVIKRMRELLESDNSRNAITIMKLYRKVALLYADKEEYDAMRKTISEAEMMVRYNKNTRVFVEVSALYYDLLSDYYDTLLDGAYDAETEEEERLLSDLLKNIDITLRYAKKIKTRDGNHLYAKNLLAKATVLMRSCLGKDVEIEKLIAEAKKVILENTMPYAEVRHQFYLVNAWYHAFISNDLKAVEVAMHLAKELSYKIDSTELDVIDGTIVPCANIYLEMMYYEKAMNILNDGIKICLKYEPLDVYKRKRSELCGYMRDVVEMLDDPKVYLGLIEQIDSDTGDMQNKERCSSAIEVICSVNSSE